MSTITQHAPGTFCWPELVTTNQDAAKKFYTSLFGWTFNDSPMAPGEVYTVFQNKGRDAAALYTLRADQRKMNVPPHWGSYVSVESADATAKKATELGGQVLMGPMDVMEHGRTAVIRDPEGAVFCLWEPKKHIGVGVYGENAALAWTELVTNDTRKSESFYTRLLPWRSEKFQGSMDYTVFNVGQNGVGGMMQITPDMKAAGAMPAWLPYFAVENANATTDKAKQLGASIKMGPQAIPDVGTISVIQDPQGAVFAILQPSPRMGA